ncbi:hypothetical protein D3C84_858110 [compost metagenome]
MASQAIDQHGHPQAAGEGEDRQQIRRECLWQAAHGGAADYGQGAAQGSAAGHPHQSGIGQRVTEQTLHGDAGQCQHRAHGQPEQGAWQADLTEDQLRLLQPLAGKWQAGQAQRGAQGLAQGQADRPQRQGQPERQQQENAQCDEQGAGMK